jgi:hypothetical protein
MFDRKKAAAELRAVIEEDLRAEFGPDLVAVSVYVSSKSAVQIDVVVSSPDQARQLAVTMRIRDRASKGGAAASVLQTIRRRMSGESPCSRPEVSTAGGPSAP